MALKVPIFIVISKVDLCTRATVERTVRQLERVLKQPGCNKVPMVIGSKDDAVMAVQQFVQSPKYVIYIPININKMFKDTCPDQDCVPPVSITPIFTLSSVSGESLDLLKVFLNVIPPLSNSKEQEELMEQLTEFQAGPQ